MPGELGKCPTCNKEVSTSAESCPHCGENDFYVRCERVEEIVPCYVCKRDGSGCYKCHGTGKYKRWSSSKDARTNERNYNDVISEESPSSPSGCAAIIAILLSIVTTGICAIVFCL